MSKDLEYFGEKSTESWADTAFDETYFEDTFSQTQQVEDYAQTVQDGLGNTSNFQEYDSYGEMTGDLPYVHEDEQEVAGEVTELPEGWEEHYDESMGSHYYLNAETGEATWVRPEANAVMSGSTAPVPHQVSVENSSDAGDVVAPVDVGLASSSLMATNSAFSFDEVSRTWNPRASALSQESAVGMSTRGSLFASLRPRVTPIMNKSLAQSGDLEKLKASTDLLALSEAAQEEKRLRIFNRHLANHAKSKLTAMSTLPALSEQGATSKHRRAPQVVVGRLNTPQKLEAVKQLVVGELDRAREVRLRHQARVFHSVDRLICCCLRSIGTRACKSLSHDARKDHSRSEISDFVSILFGLLRLLLLHCRC
jgi:hypothetical protein